MHINFNDLTVLRKWEQAQFGLDSLDVENALVNMEELHELCLAHAELVQLAQKAHLIYA